MDQARSSQDAGIAATEVAPCLPPPHRHPECFRRRPRLLQYGLEARHAAHGIQEPAVPRCRWGERPRTSVMLTPRRPSNPSYRPGVGLFRLPGLGGCSESGSRAPRHVRPRFQQTRWCREAVTQHSLAGGSRLQRLCQKAIRHLDAVLPARDLMNVANIEALITLEGHYGTRATGRWRSCLSL